MRLLILALVAYIAAVVSFQRPAKSKGVADALNSADRDGESLDGDLSARLTEAADTFNAAAQQMAAPHQVLRSSVENLSRQCAVLALRATEDDGFSRRNRTAILQLLFPLYGVVRRVTELSQRAVTPRAKELFATASVLIGGATEALGGIAERADETALRHLETDLEILEERLSGEV